MKKTDIHPVPEYFDRYIALADDAELFEMLGTSLREIENLPVDVWKALGDKAYAPEKWTGKDLLQHMIDTERIFTYRALAFSRNEPQKMQSFDEGSYAENAGASRRSVEDLVEEWILVRRSFIAMFRSFTDEMLLRIGTGFTGRYSVLSIGYLIAGHQRWHFRVFEEKYLPLLGK